MKPAISTAPVVADNQDDPDIAGQRVEKVTFLQRRAVRVTVLVVAFTVVMLVANSAASVLSHPVAAMLVGPLIGALVLWLYTVALHWFEGRTFATRRVEGRSDEPRRATELARPAAGRLIVGAVAGVTLGTATIGAIAAFGGYQITGWGSLGAALTVVGIMCAVAVAEEVLFRGVIFRLAQQQWGTWVALVLSALPFGLVHLVNPGATVWGALAVAIEAGLLLGAAYAATGSLWLPIGLHLGWNVTITAIFGTVTSGSEAQGALVHAVTDGPTWLTGGEFGPEASVIAIAVCLIATALLLFVAYRKGRLGAAGRR